MSINVTVREGEAVRVQVGENTALALAQAAIASAARDEAGLARDSALAAGRFRPTKAAAEAAFPEVGGMIAYLDSGILTFAERTSGGSTVLPDDAQPVGRTTLDDYARTDGAVGFATNGERVGITSENTPLLPTALLQIENRQVSTGLRCSSYWASPYNNNDNSLWETYNKVTADSSNWSWSISAPNGYNDIPADVTDSGERLGVYGWAVSVNLPGEYEHKGTLASQVGVGGRAGFRGDINTSPATAIIQSACGVRGDVVGESPLATIENGYGGRFLVPDTIASGVLNAYAVYAEAGAGSLANWSFFGAAGDLYNRDTSYLGEGTVTASKSTPAVCVRADKPNNIEFGSTDSGGYGCNIGATAPSGLPFIVFNGEAEGSGNTFRTRGKLGVTLTTDLAGALAFGRLTNSNGTGQTPTTTMTLRADGKVAFEETVLLRSRTPASATDTGEAGEFRWDDSYLYICTATDTWKRVAVATW